MPSASRAVEFQVHPIDRLQEAGEEGGLGEVAVMRDLAARHIIVHLGMPDLRGVVVCIDPEQRNEDAERQP
ncbi:hypothetical protein [Streptomyces sp. NPDC047315]|uniref:hypothetical protein n=1 Tax=Streptomyces sp. NPDC047315 TaxID=3155142 RepID=UPI0033FDC15F